MFPKSSLIILTFDVEIPFFLLGLTCELSFLSISWN
jgi:hypothetical protein